MLLIFPKREAVMPINITFRTQLLGGVSEFCQQSNLTLISNTLHLVELIVLLARYKEEGVSLCPKVYLTNGMDTLSSMLPEGERIKIGITSQDAKGIKLAIKKCAPLANGGWLIYIQDGVNNIEYGLFKGSGNPISVLVDDVLMGENDGIIVVKVFQVAEDCVEIKANNGLQHYVFLNHRKEESPPPLQFLDKLVSEITSITPEQEREPLISFLTRLLFETLRQSHGCIIAVTNMNKPPKFLSHDGVILEHPIDFVNLITELKKGQISSSCLESKGSLLQGMLNSDGIILFDNKGRLLGYNCFVKVSHKNDINGGARKRAFDALKNKVGSGLCAVFMQSQDGWSEFRSVENGQ